MPDLRACPRRRPPMSEPAPEATPALHHYYRAAIHNALTRSILQGDDTTALDYEFAGVLDDMETGQ